MGPGHRHERLLCCATIRRGMPRRLGARAVGAGAPTLDQSPNHRSASSSGARSERRQVALGRGGETSLALRSLLPPNPQHERPDGDADCESAWLQLRDREKAAKPRGSRAYDGARLCASEPNPQHAAPPSWESAHIVRQYWTCSETMPQSPVLSSHQTHISEEPAHSEPGFIP